jgi:N-acetylglutamate synthase
MPSDVERIERATVDGVAPLLLEELPGWLLPLDRGEVNRAISAVPLHHGEHDPAVVPEIVARYRAHARAPQFRLADVPGLAALQDSLAAAGFEPRLPTYMQLADTARIAAVGPDPAIVLTTVPDEGFGAVFQKVAFTHASPAERAARLARAAESAYATLRVDGTPVAVGALTFARGLACVHSMRTTEAARGRGYGRRVLTSLALAAADRGAQSIILQVEEVGSAARALYASAGFEVLWRYRYWRQSVSDEPSGL